METINERLAQLVNFYADGNQSAFTKMVGLPEGSLSNYLAKGSMPGADKLEKIVNSLDVDAMWLLTGKGEMKRKLKCTQESSELSELLQLCKSLVTNYQQRDEVMGKLVSMVKILDF